MSGFWNKLTTLFKGQTNKNSSSTTVAPKTAVMAKNAAEMVMMTRDQEADCEEAFKFLDEYAEKVQSGTDVENLLPLVHHHLSMCPDCRQEYEMLLAVIE